MLLFYSDGVLWHSDVLLSLLIRAALRQTERFTQHVRCLDKSQTVLLFHIEVPLVDVSLVMSHHLLDFSLDRVSTRKVIIVLHIALEDFFIDRKPLNRLNRGIVDETFAGHFQMLLHSLGRWLYWTLPLLTSCIT